MSLLDYPVAHREVPLRPDRLPYPIPISLGQNVAQRLGNADPDQALAVVDALLVLGMTAFDWLEWTVVPDGGGKRERQVLTVWECALVGALNAGGPTPALERLADAQDQHWANQPEHGLGKALHTWFKDGWDLVWLLRHHDHPGALTLATWVLERAQRSLRQAPGPWPDEAMRLRCKNLQTPDPCVAQLPEAWQDPLGRALLQGLMLNVSRLGSSDPVQALMAAAERAGLPLIAWAARWHHQDPENPTDGMGLLDAPFLIHLARMNHWTVLQWWRTQCPEASVWASATMQDHRPRLNNPVVHVSLGCYAGAQVVGKEHSFSWFSAGDNACAQTARQEVLTDVLHAAIHGDPDAREAVDQRLGMTLRSSSPDDWKGTPEDRARVMALLVTYDRTRLTESLTSIDPPLPALERARL